MKGGGAIVEERFVYEKEKHLLVMKTNLFFASDGFTVYDGDVNVVFRVDSYGPDTHDAGELVLMDPSGRCILTVRRKRPSLHQRWQGFVGDRRTGDLKPIFSVRRSSMIGPSNVTVEVFGVRKEEYLIKGSFTQRNCTIYNSEKEIIAVIKRRVDISTNMMLGKDVFSLTLMPGFDGAFAMGLVMVLDQTNGIDNGDDDDGTVDRSTTINGQRQEE
ncbi:hypothetical protein OSB04_030648 [Centaurea solstitialis]|uniref:Uncharacterized protein n=1 Tax=Centaurea solstitialis TaxID=347529 RepID=A0AA38S822_9ASTR|nr:hypothetical protein OSB04_030648 [Centaurea solstitialis]